MPFQISKDYIRDVRWLQKITGYSSYVTNKFRFDLLYYVNVVARHTLYPNEQTKKLAIQLIQYIWDTRDTRLVWYKTENPNKEITAITDAAHAVAEELKSQLGYFYIYNNKVIGGKSTTAVHRYFCR